MEDIWSDLPEKQRKCLLIKAGILPEFWVDSWAMFTYEQQLNIEVAYNGLLIS